ncbi:hypothetical protein GCM10009836_68220 [Pseudonocardia ailaonensis]|uniref:Uncharacterized protein n=1 Tax=Pseudonocardia ailaonensis TaxID=367279 RepID=A0ABN2NP06_9PSEU
MYCKIGNTAFFVAPAGAATFGGLDALWWAVALCTVVAAILALFRLLPPLRRAHRQRPRRHGGAAGISARSAASPSGRGSHRRPRRQP